MECVDFKNKLTYITYLLLCWVFQFNFKRNNTLKRINFYCAKKVITIESEPVQSRNLFWISFSHCQYSAVDEDVTSYFLYSGGYILIVSYMNEKKWKPDLHCALWRVLYGICWFSLVNFIAKPILFMKIQKMSALWKSTKLGKFPWKLMYRQTSNRVHSVFLQCNVAKKRKAFQNFCFLSLDCFYFCCAVHFLFCSCLYGARGNAWRGERGVMCPSHVISGSI